MSPSTNPTPAHESGYSIRIKVEERTVELTIPEELREDYERNSASIISETRRLCGMLERSHQPYDPQQMLETQIHRHLENAERRGHYTLYKSLMRQFGIKNRFGYKEFTNYCGLRREVGETHDVLVKRIEYILEQGWKLGSRVRTKTRPQRTFTIETVDKKCRLSFKDSLICDNDPLLYESA